MGLLKPKADDTYNKNYFQEVPELVKSVEFFYMFGQDGFQRPQEASKRPHEGPKRPPESPKRPHEASGGLLGEAENVVN